MDKMVENWRELSVNDIEFILSYGENKHIENRYKMIFKRIFLNEYKTLGKMADAGYTYWKTLPGVGKRTADIFIEMINNMAEEEVVKQWNSCDTPPTHNNPVLAVVDLARPQDEILRKTWFKPKIKIASYRDGKWDHQGDVLKITHWSELPEMP